MSNTLGILEVTLTQIIDPASDANVLGTTRLSAFEPLTVRVLGHDADTGAETDDPDLMALFTSKAQGQPWKKENNTLAKVSFVAEDATTACDSDATYIVPFFDYTGDFV